MWPPSRSARTMASAWSTRRTARPARHVACGNVSWSECRRAAVATDDGPIGSRSTACCKSSRRRRKNTNSSYKTAEPCPRLRIPLECHRTTVSCTSPPTTRTLKPSPPHPHRPPVHTFRTRQVTAWTCSPRCVQTTLHRCTCSSRIRRRPVLKARYQRISSCQWLSRECPSPYHPRTWHNCFSLGSGLPQPLLHIQEQVPVASHITTRTCWRAKRISSAIQSCWPNRCWAWTRWLCSGRSRRSDSAFWIRRPCQCRLHRRPDRCHAREKLQALRKWPDWSKLPPRRRRKR